MPIIGSAKIYTVQQSAGGTVEELARKHQRNAKNNGVDVIDYVNAVRENRAVRGDLTRIHAVSSNRTFVARFKDVPEVVIGYDTELLFENGNYGSIHSGAVRQTSKVGFVVGQSVEFKTIMEVYELKLPQRQYCIRVPNKGNYFLESGLIVGSD